MNYRMMGRFIGKILMVEAVFMIPALLISLWGREMAAVKGLLVGIAATLICAGLLLWLGKGSKKKFFAKEGMACVGLCWIVMSMLGCLPFYVSGEIPHYVDALFEMVSGFTTTGASILSDVEAMSKGLLYWRSFSHWLGGDGSSGIFACNIIHGKRGQWIYHAFA